MTLAPRVRANWTTERTVKLFPQPGPRDTAAEEQIEQWLKLRAVIAQAVEPARQQKLIGNALEASVTLRTPDAATLQGMQTEMEEFFILSELHLEPGDEPSASLTRTEFRRCDRCWRHRAEVGRSAAHPDLCERCEKVIST